MATGGDVGNNFPFDSGFAAVLLDLIDGIVAACDAAAPDPDLEAEEDCCAAYDDLGGLPAFPPWCLGGVASDNDDAEPDADDEETTPPGFLQRSGLWRGAAVQCIVS